MRATTSRRNYYAALGVPKTATAADIKKGLRNRPRPAPDKKPGDHAAEERFQEVSEAYDVLSDDTKRREYDEARSLFAAACAPASRCPRRRRVFSFDLGDLPRRRRCRRCRRRAARVFGGLFGGRSSGRGPRRGRTSRPR